MRHIIPFMLCFCVGFCVAATSVAAAGDTSSLDRVLEDERGRVEVIERVSKATVCVFDQTRDGGGAGVLIDPQGYGLTNFHVIQAIVTTRRGFGGLSDGKLYPLELLGIDPGGDVAMFKLEGRDDFPVAKMGDSSQLRLGDTTIALGNPFSLANDYTPTVTMGIVTGLHRYQYGSGDKLVYTDCIQTDSSINPGNSGGPLFDRAGRIVGINGRASFARRGRINIGLAYAISINQMKKFVPGLRAGLLVRHGSLGATVRDLPDGTVVVDALLQRSPAALADVRLNDTLAAFSGVDVHTANQFLSLLGTYPERWPVELVVERAGERMTKTVRLEPAEIKLPAPFKVDATVNRRAARRVWSAWQAATGRADRGNTIQLNGHRTEHRTEGEKADRVAMAVQSRRDGTYRLTLREADGQSATTEQCGGDGVSKRIGDQEALVSPRRARELKTQRALLWTGLFPLKEDLSETARHVGGDEIESVILDVLEINTASNKRIHLGIDMSTGLLRRFTMWFDDQAARVVIDLSDHRRSGELLLPHRWRMLSPQREPILIQVDQYEMPSP